MLDTEYEVGHFEPCTKVTGAATTPISDTLNDTYYTNCHGPYEKGQEDPNLEPDDSPCFPFGDTHGGAAPPNLVTGCDVFFDAIGDLDYDGTPYYADWPTSTQPGKFPGTTPQTQPTSQGQTYPYIQFETDLPATEFNTNCDLTTGAGCVVPPAGPGHFYPYWTLAKDQQLGCTWQFGNAGATGNSFGGDAQYGQITFNPPGAFTSQIRPNPSCQPRH
jgi:hypothetical protein